MSDITKCTGNDCSMKASCFRFLAEDEGENQTFFSKPPFLVEEGKSKCKFYWHFLEDKFQY